MGIYQVLETVANEEYILHAGHMEIELKGGNNKTLIYKDNANNDGNINNGSGTDTGETANIEVKSGHDYIDEQGKIITNFSLNTLVTKKNDAITFEILEGAVEVTFSNYLFEHILVTKVDSITNKPLINCSSKNIDDGFVIDSEEEELITVNQKNIT